MSTSPDQTAPIPQPEDRPQTAPAIDPPRWRGRKTAIAAALAIGLGSAGSLAAAATIDQGGTTREGGVPGGRQGGPGGQQGGLPGGRQQGGPGGAQQGQPSTPQSPTTH